MTVYALRDKDGVLKAEFSPRMAREVFTHIDGHWREHRSKFTYAAARAYEIDKAVTLGNRRMRICFWKGDIVVEESREMVYR